MTKQPEAAFTLRFEKRPDYLYAFVSGPRDSLAVSCEFWKQVHARATELEAQNIIVEEDFPNQLSTMDMYHVVEFMTEIFPYKTSIAHVDRQASDMEINNFGETVGVNRGLHHRAFNNLAGAQEWIKE